MWRKYCFLRQNLFLTEDDLKIDSVYIQNLLTEYKTLLYDYNELIILYGYVVLFSVVAPLTPLIIFVLIYIEKFVDSYKFFFLQRTTIINPSNGIEIYKYILFVFFFIGVITNIGLIQISDYDNKNQSLIFKFVAYLIFENIVIICMWILSFNILPFCKK